jgi:flagellar biosynthetic protein FliP
LERSNSGIGVATWLSGMHRLSIPLAALLFAGAILLAPVDALALPRIDISVGGPDASGPAQVSSALKILAALTILSLVPAILMLMTAFTRIVIVLSFVRQSLGVQAMPPNQVLVGLALLLSLFVMAPVGKQVHEQALSPYLQGKLSEEKALEAGIAPIRGFMLQHTRVKDLELLLEMTATPQPQSARDVPLHALVPAFVLSELTTAFHMGFLIFVPFLVLDFVLASVLMSMGMVMLPPALISLPLKVMLFVLVDGWHLVVASLVRSFA